VVNLRRDMIQGLVRLRVLRAAMSGPISGVELSANLGSVGYRVSPGTLYPLLHELEKAGWLKSKGRTVKGKRRRYYRATKKGRIQVEEALSALHQFLFDSDGASPADSGAAMNIANGIATIIAVDLPERD
jgi:PadR family transcriptional regulator, regulatory protein PadR